MGETGYADLEIRILKLEDQGYPVEMSLNREQEFPPGYLRHAIWKLCQALQTAGAAVDAFC
jgi:biotin operon repressor